MPHSAPSGSLARTSRTSKPAPKAPTMGDIPIAPARYARKKQVVTTATTFTLSGSLFVTKRLPESVKVVAVVTTCFFLAYLAGAIGISPIVGAFGAGLLVRDVRARDPEGAEW